MFETLKPAIQQAAWSPLGEEYFVFQLPAEAQWPAPAKLLEQNSAWLAGLVRLESAELSRDEIVAALQSHICYSPHDLLLAAWSAAVLVDRDCEETLQAIEFANLQLLEFRYIDNLLDERLAAAYSTIHRTLRGRLPFCAPRRGRCAGSASCGSTPTAYSSAGNALKMVGDQYLARVYRLVAERFHLGQWEQSIRSSLDVVEGTYQVMSDQSGSFRVEMLEIIVIVLIAIEIVMALLRH